MPWDLMIMISIINTSPKVDYNIMPNHPAHNPKKNLHRRNACTYNSYQPKQIKEDNKHLWYPFDVPRASFPLPLPDWEAKPTSYS